LLSEALAPGLAEGGLFVPGDFDIPVGSPIAVRVTALGLATEVFVEGLVQWRRVHGRVRQTGINPGLGVRMLTSHQERLQFLRNWAGGRSEESGRYEPRCPTNLACVLTSIGRNTGRMLHATLRDARSDLRARDRARWHGAIVSSARRVVGARSRGTAAHARAHRRADAMGARRRTRESTVHARVDPAAQCFDRAARGHSVESARSTPEFIATGAAAQ
jgi:Tfp pilus assembly protein PilZ